MKRFIHPSGIFIIWFCLSIQVFAQESPLSVKLGAIKTDLKENALNVGISYLKSLDSLWEKQDFLYDRDKSLFLITPDINIQSGTMDAFSSVSIKATGLWMLFDTIKIAGQITPNTGKTFHTFPMSIGIETNNNFDIINGIFEVGYVPWYQSHSAGIPDWIKRTKFGIFLQGGYKFELDTTGVNKTGGEVNNSKEEINNPIFRAKASFGINTGSLINLNYLKIGLVGLANGWYDLINQEIYYMLEGKVRFYLSDDKFFDFEYQKGSGAPNFNKGDQYGIGLTVTF